MKSAEEIAARAGELRKLIEDAQAEIASAEAALANASSESDRVRAHKRIDAASVELERARRELPAVDTALATARSRNEAAAEAARWEQFEKLGHAWREKMAALQNGLATVAALHLEVHEAGLAFRSACPLKIDGTEDGSFMWAGSRLTQETQVRLAVITEGRFNARNLGRTELWQLAQGPDLVAKVRENVSRLLARKPRRPRAA